MKALRAYKFRAFRPIEGEEHFDNAVALKKAMWSDLCDMEGVFFKKREVLFGVPKEERDSAAIKNLLAQRTQKIKEIRQLYAARGLHFGDYNATIFQFDGACQASRKRKAIPTMRDDVMGDCVVKQIQGGAKFHHLMSRSDVSIEAVPPNEKERLRTGKRKAYRRFLMTFAIRTPRTPCGEAIMKLGFITDRPIPPSADIVEVRVLKKIVRIVNLDGIVRDIPRWSVAFITKDEILQKESGDVTGVSLTWKEDELGIICGYYSNKSGVRPILYPDSEKGLWDSWRFHRDAALKIWDEAERIARLAELERTRLRLVGRRKDAIRLLAKKIVTGNAAIAVDSTFLSGKGVKGFSAPSTLRLELQRAAENAGCLFVKEKVKEPCEKKRAKILRDVAGKSMS